MDETSSAPLAVQSSARPVRVAYFFDPETVTNEDVDSVIRFCTSCWGGRYCAFVPIVEGDIPSDWSLFFKSLDPDIIYPLCAISDELFDKVCRSVPPCRFLDFTPQTAKRPLTFQGVPFAGVQSIPRYLWSQRNSIRQTQRKLSI